MQIIINILIFEPHLGVYWQIHENQLDLVTENDFKISLSRKNYEFM